MSRDLFSANKQKVRRMDLRLIERHFRPRKGYLRYLGLPASTMTDLVLWGECFCHFTAVERGRAGEEFRYQHDLMLTALKRGVAGRLKLLRGDMDDILVEGADRFGNRLEYPFDVVSLDYSGGLLYKNDEGQSRRAESIEQMVRSQAAEDQDFLFLLSCNLDSQDQGEIRAVLRDIGRELGKFGICADETVSALLAHPLEEARLRAYVPRLISHLSSTWYQCEHYKPIFYEGNRDTRMMHFGAWLHRTESYVAGRPSRQTLVHILNLKSFRCENGALQPADFGLPEVAFPDAPDGS